MKILKKDERYGTINISSLDTDSTDYHILASAVANIRTVKGLTLEIGTRAGGSSKVIIDSIMKSNPLGIRTHVCIDPYGGLDYQIKDDEIIEDAYPDKVRDIAIPALFRYCVGSKVNFQFYQMTDTQFFKRFDDGVPVYVNGKEEIINTYALVFFDGPHSTDAVMDETKFFETRVIPGSIFVYDDVKDYYNHTPIHNHLLNTGWKLSQASPYKASYVKS
jgi:hypothetical protein